ncbi:MAG: hypothetical protein AAF511_05615 [Pseudomonadota bacterium]
MSDYDKAYEDRPGQPRRPVHTERDGAVAFKVWENTSKDGRVYHKVTLDKAYTDPATGQTQSTRSFDQSDLLKIAQLAQDTHRAVNRIRLEERGLQENQALQNGMQQARDQAMAQSGPQHGHDHAPRRTRQPQQR